MRRTLITEEQARHHRRRRCAELVKHPRHMWRLQHMRRAESATGYSLRQFENTKSIFIHIPKASGVSIAQSLYGNMGCGHMPMRDYETAFGPAFIRNSFIFTFVRNPWDRLHSAYRFLAKGGMNRADAQWLQQNKAYMTDFECFVLNGLVNPKVAQSLHIVPQEQFLISASYRYGAIDFVGLFENIESDFQTVCHAVRGAPLPLSHSNRTSDGHSDYRTAYTDRMCEIVGQFYAKDIEYFGYDFDGASIANQIRRRDNELFF